MTAKMTLMDKPFLHGFKKNILLLVICISAASVVRAGYLNQDSLIRVIRQQDWPGKLKNLDILAKSGDVNDTIKNEFILREINALPESQVKDEAVLYALDDIGHYFFKCNLPKYSLPATLKGYSIALLTSNVNYQISSAILLSQNYFFLHQVEQSNHYLNLASHLADQHNLSKYKASILNTRANNASELGYNLEALYLYLQTADLLKSEKNYGDLGVVYDNIGLLHMAMENHAVAITVFQSALELISRHGSKQTLINTTINMGVCYLELDSLNKAEEIFQKALLLAGELQNEYQRARVLLNIANLKSKQKDYAAARINLEHSLAICINNNILPGVVFNKINLGELYIKTKQPALALQILKEAEQSAAGLSIPEQLAECYRLMSLASEQVKNNGQALSYFKKYHSLQDSLFRTESKLHMREMENRIEMEQSLKEFSELKEKILITKTKNQIVIISILGLLLFVGGIAIYLYMRRKTVMFNARLAAEESHRLRLQVENKNKELASKAIHISKMNEVSVELSDKLKTLLPGLNREKAVELQQIIRSLKKGTPLDAWKEFEMRFEQVHLEFYQKLQTLCPTLTPTEIKICSFLRLNLTSKEISSLTNRSIGTIDNTRSSIRKKLNLENDSNLTTFLLGV
jgi:tetratricopeptide (TPR) repeat protein/DNA-binding CsgD family transcriptional regulator